MEKKRMRYEDVLQEIGEFGRYQKIQFLLVCVVSITSSFHSMNMVFVGPTPEHHCALPPQLSMLNLSQQELLELAIPASDGKPASCLMYNVSDVDWTGNLTLWTSSNRSTHSCTHGWTYSTQFYQSTIVTQWDLVCENRWMRSLASSIYFAGRLAGALISGFLSDRFGRLRTFYGSVVLQVVSGFVAAFSPSIIFFYVVYFIQGVVQVAVYLTIYVLGVELLGPKYRKLTGVSVNYFYTLGQVLLTGIAFASRRWNWIEIIISVIPVLYFLYYWVISESVQWLLSKGRDQEAWRILQKAAKTNGVKLTDCVLESLSDPSTQEAGKSSFLDILRNWRFCLIAINIWFNWLANALVYYGLSLNTSKLAGNPYVNFLLAALVELPSLTVVMLLIDRVGRRRLFMAFMVLAGVACISTAFVPKHLSWVSTTLSMVGKFGVTASYSVIYLMAAEVFPTVIRNVGMGISSVCARVGGILAPQILLIGDFVEPLPLIIFGTMSISGGLLALGLPEYTGKPLATDLSDFSSTRSKENGVTDCSEADDSLVIKV